MANVIELTHDTATACVLPGVGMNCFSLAFDGVETLYAEPGFDAGDKRASSGGIPILFPFPGRIKGQTMAWRGRNYAVGGDTVTGNAIHGFCHTRPWTVTDRQADRVTAVFDSAKADGDLGDRWPSSFALTATYRLSVDALSLKLTMANTGDEDLPCGLGLHPYFLVPPGGANVGDADAARRDEVRVRLPAETKWRMQEMIATGKGLPAVTKQAQLVEIMGRHLSDAVSGGASPQAAMDAAAEELRDLL